MSRHLARRPIALAAALGVAIALVCEQTRASPPGPAASGRRHLSGEWGGLRPALAARGVEIDLLYTADVIATVDGGRRRGADVLGSVDLALAAELDLLVGWRGARLWLYGLGTHGGDPSDRVGDVQIVDNIEAFDTWKLYEAWLEQDLFRGAASLRAGLSDLNAEFDVIPAARPLLNSSFGTGAELGTSGRNGPSTFPVTSLAARVEVRPAPRLSLRAVVADGVPGDPDDPRGTQVHLAKGDGALLAGELALEGAVELESGGACIEKYALGAWTYTTKFEPSLDPGRAPGRGAAGVYALAERCVYAEAADPSQGLSLFGRAGVADSTGSVVDAYLGGGLLSRGLLPRRPRDAVAFGVAAAHFSSAFRDAVASGTRRGDPWEVALELTYVAQLAPWLALQPDVQWVIDPGSEPGLPNAWVVGARLRVAF